MGSVGVFPKALQEPVVVLTQNTQIHLAHFIDSLSPLRIIADGSNYKSYLDRWRQTCIEKKSLFIAPMKRGLLYVNKYYLDLKVPLKFF